MKGDVKDALEQALKVEELHVEEVGGELFVGNSLLTRTRIQGHLARRG